MAIYELTKDSLRKIEETSFGEEKIRERTDLQRILRSQIGVIASDVLVITEEFGEWDGSKRRIDLLGIDKNANLVVIELKRTDDGGHMDLQSVRYAAMVSTMTFDKAVELYGNLHRDSVDDARGAILSFLDWDVPDEEQFAQDVRIVLVSADFSRELTTTVMWLNERDLNITCVRMKPYQDAGRLFVDVQQVIPLPEAADYAIRIKDKEVRERSVRRKHLGDNAKFARFWAGLQERSQGKTDIHRHLDPPERPRLGGRVGGPGMNFDYAANPDVPLRVELKIFGTSEVKSKPIFDALFSEKQNIEQAFGQPLQWERQDDKITSRIRYSIHGATFSDDEEKWPEIQDLLINNMVRFEQAMRPAINRISFSQA